jgi:hypothetical protein
MFPADIFAISLISQFSSKLMLLLILAIPRLLNNFYLILLRGGSG